MLAAPIAISWAMSPVPYAGCDRWAGAPSHHRRGNHPIACTPPPAQLLLPLSALSAGLTAAIESEATDLEAVVTETLDARVSERAGRLIDHDEAGAMEMKKREGYF